MTVSRPTKLQKAASDRAKHQPRDDIGRFTTTGGRTVKIQRFTDSIGQKRSLPPVQINANLRSVDSFVKTGGATGKKKVVTVGKMQVEIPIDDEGFVPKEFLIQRYFDIEHIGKNGKLRYRRPHVDSKKDAKIIFPDKRYRPEEIAPWVAHPNRYDIEGIDTAGSPGAIYDYTAKRSKEITIANAYGNQEETIRKRLNDNFSEAERNKLSKKNRLLILVGRPPGKGTRGTYEWVKNKIYVDPNTLEENSTIVHETVHALRYNDGDRTDLITRTRAAKAMKMADVTLEEAATQAETMARLNPWMPKKAGYYGYFTDDDKGVVNLATHDRRVLTGSTEKSLIEKSATDSVEKNFDKTAISHLQLKGSPFTARDYVKYLRGKQG